MLKHRLVLTLQRKYSKNAISSLQIKNPELTIDQYVMEKWHQWEDKVAVECAVSGKRLTYKELRHRSKSLGVALSQLGFKKKTALLAMSNCPEYPLALLGALQAGMTVCPASPLSIGNELKYLMADTGVRCALTSSEYLDNIQGAVGRSEVAVISTGSASQEGVICFEQLSNIRDPYEELLPTTEEKMDQLVLLPYSSGTRGLPKGLRFDHNNIINSIEQTDIEVDSFIEAKENNQNVAPSLMPFTDIYKNTFMALRCLRMGAKILYLPKFHPEDFLRLLTSNKVIRD